MRQGVLGEFALGIGVEVHGALGLQILEILSIDGGDEREYLLETDIRSVQSQVHAYGCICWQSRPAINGCLYRIQRKGVLLQCILAIGKVGIDVEVGSYACLVQ